MNQRAIKSISFALIGLLLFLGILILSRLYSGNEIPTQFAGALLGAIVTAAITMALLHGQSQAEETKERNVKVFEEKTRRYNEFLERLWAIWEDRHITLEELNELKEAVARDILLYTREDSTEQLLGFLNGIAKHAGPANLSDIAKAEVQESVYGVINVLAKEIDLGGRISDSIKVQLDELDRQIRPFLLEKEFRAKLKDAVNRALRNSKLDVVFDEPKYERYLGFEYLWVRIERSPIYLTLGPVVIDDPVDKPYIGLFVEFSANREFQEYRAVQKGWRRDYLDEIKYDVPLVNFNSVEGVANWAREHQGVEDNSPTARIAAMMVDYIKEWGVKGHDIRSLLDVCGYGNTEKQSHE
jgi:hypothetical protein